MTKADRERVRDMADRFDAERDLLWYRLLSELQEQIEADPDEVRELFGALT